MGFCKMVLLCSMAKLYHFIFVNKRYWKFRWQCIRFAGSTCCWGHCIFSYFKNPIFHIQPYNTFFYYPNFKFSFILYFVLPPIKLSSAFRIHKAFRSFSHFNDFFHKLCSFIFRIKWVYNAWCWSWFHKQTNLKYQW